MMIRYLSFFAQLLLGSALIMGTFLAEADAPPSLQYTKLKLLNYTAVTIKELAIYNGNFLTIKSGYDDTRYRASKCDLRKSGCIQDAETWLTHNQLAPHPTTPNADGKYYFFNIPPIKMDDAGPVVRTMLGTYEDAYASAVETSSATIMDLSLDASQVFWEAPGSGDPIMSIFLALSIGSGETQLKDQCAVFIYSTTVSEVLCSSNRFSLSFFKTGVSTTDGGKTLVLAFGCDASVNTDCPLITVYKSVLWKTSTGTFMTGEQVRQACGPESTGSFICPGS